MSLATVRKKILQRTKNSAILKYFVYFLTRLLFATYRLEITYDKAFTQPLQMYQGIFYLWHQHIIAGMCFAFKNNNLGYCVVSPSYDGKIAGFICKKLGFNVLYGSSHRASISLVRSCLQVLKHTSRLYLVGDGSRGPALRLQPGIVYLANKADLPLIFIDCKPDLAITIKKSWDQFKIPLPFSKISVHINAPYYPTQPQKNT